VTEVAVPIARRASRSPGLRLLGDERLARRAADGDSRAFAVIYDRHHQGLFRFCRSILGNPDDAADALQSTMLAALQSLRGESRAIALKPWLYRIAHNESISLLRRRPQTELVGETDALVPGPDRDAALRERMRMLVADLRSLPDRPRGALVMRELSGLDYEQVGAALGISQAAAKQAVYEARRALAELAEGRAMDCESVRRSISDRDGRRLRARKLRAHLRHCAGCRAFEECLAERRADLRALAPPLPAAAAATVLQSILGGGSVGGGGGGPLALLAELGGAGTAVKGVAAGTLAAIAGIGAVEVADLDGDGGGRPEAGSSGVQAPSSLAPERGPGAPLEPTGAERSQAEQPSSRKEQTGEHGRADERADAGDGRGGARAVPATTGPVADAVEGDAAGAAASPALGADRGAEASGRGTAIAGSYRADVDRSSEAGRAPSLVDGPGEAIEAGPDADASGPLAAEQSAPPSAR
jgi:RNA polymerase sigma factor (sigma-70 family)